MGGALLLVTVICTGGFGCGPYLPPNYVRIWNEGVFDLSQPANPSSRPPGDDLDYDNAQRKEWTDRCRPLLNKSYASFQNCFRDLQNRNRDLVRRQREAVQNRTEKLIQR